MIPLEDNFNDVLGKAQRGLKLTDEALAAAADVSVAQLTAAKEGQFEEPVVRRLAGPLRLQADALAALGKKSWYPAPVGDIDGLACFNTPFLDMTVNAYLVWDPITKDAAVFDTGADALPILRRVEELRLHVQMILLTHTHGDHVADLDRLKRDTHAPAFVGADEGFAGAEAFHAGRAFAVSRLRIDTRRTSGHARGGITYVVSGLSRPVAVVGDALFAASMGGGMVSYEEALQTNRASLFTLPDETVICPGHGPLTTVGEQKRHNPFFPELAAG